MYAYLSYIPQLECDNKTKKHMSVTRCFFFILFGNVATTANVGIQLYGEDAFSSACHLYKDGAFHRSAEDLFLVATQSSLGPIWKVCVNYKLTEHIVSVA